MKTISQSELRNRVSGVLREVEAGERVRISVNGVADLVPVGGMRCTFVPREHIAALLRRAPLDRNFARDLEQTDANIDML